MKAAWRKFIGYWVQRNCVTKPIIKEFKRAEQRAFAVGARLTAREAPPSIEAPPSMPAIRRRRTRHGGYQVWDVRDGRGKSIGRRRGWKKWKCTALLLGGI